MAKPDSDRNLLVGVLALQLSLVDEQQLLAAMKVWAFEKTVHIEDIFLKRGFIDESNRQLLLSMVDRGQSRDAQGEPSFESLPTVTAALEKLSAIDDRELQDSVTDFLHGVNADPPRGFEQTQAFNDGQRGGRFRILRPLAVGGLGQVSVAEDLELHREVALKEIKPKYLGSAENRSRFLIEAEVTGRLEHPGIVPVYSLGSGKNGAPFYAMQFIRGMSLSEAIREHHSKSPTPDWHSQMLETRKLVGRLVNVCQAVTYAHSKGVLHRDIKPQNIMLGKFGETFLVDWGLARIGNRDLSHHQVPDAESMLVPASGSGSSATRLGTMIGTPEYMSPEQADGRLNDMGPASDVFSLGATLYCVLTGRHPTSDRQTTERTRLDYGNFTRPSSINRQVPLALEAICMKALATEINDRYGTADELTADLESWLADEPVSAYREPPSEQARRWLRQHRALAATIAGVSFTAIVALVGLLAISRSHNLALAQANVDIGQAKVEAELNLASARKLASNQLRDSEDTLSQSELSPGQIRELRAKLSEQAFQEYEKWYKSHPDDRDVANEFAYTARAMSNVKRTVLKFGEAATLIAASLAAQRKVPLEQKTEQEKADYALTLTDASELDLLQGRLTQALLLTDESQKTLQAINLVQYGEAEHLRASSTLHFQRAGILFELGKLKEALAENQQSLAGLETLNSGSKLNETLQAMRFLALIREFQIVEELGERNQAMSMADKVVTQAQAASQRSLRSFKYGLFLSMDYAAKYRIDAGVELGKAESMLKETVELLRIELSKGKSATLVEANSMAHRLLGEIYRRQSKYTESLEALTRAQSEAELLVKVNALADYLRLQAEAQYQMSLTHQASGDNVGAKQMLGAAQQSLTAASQSSPESARVRKMLELVNGNRETATTEK